jgi:hypothetical protein
MFKVEIDRGLRLLTFRASGTITVEEMKQVTQDARYVTDAFKNGPHIVLADLRGMAVVSDEVARMMGEVMRYGREHGTVCCVHLSDSSIARLQTARLAREVTPDDKITINVVSLEEADRVVQEKQALVKRPK